MRTRSARGAETAVLAGWCATRSVTPGRPIAFGRDIDYGDVRQDAAVPRRTTYLGQTVKRLVQHSNEPHYPQGPFFNR